MPDEQRLALHVLDGGTLAPQHQMVFLKGGQHRVTLPIPYFLVRHPRGNVLVDGGLQLDACRDPVAYFGADLVAAMRPQVSEANHMRAQLAAIDVDPGSIRYVVQSHLHFDHTGALGELPEATFLVHRRELEYAAAPDWFADGYQARDLERADVRWQAFDLDEDEPDMDLYGDGAVRIVFTPGHSAGLVAVLVTLEQGTVLLAGDAADTATHYAHRALPGLYLDGPAVVRSIERLRHLEQTTGALVIFGHDVEQWPHLRHGRDAYV
jgi:glyoxylase-like metal-dependent hydrolase (beta-lactamase superfamily II)